MKNKLLTIVLVLAIVMSVFSGVCLVASAEEGESPNLLEMYGLNPGFNDGIAPWRTGGTAAIESSDEDSADDDGYCAKITGRDVDYSTARLTGTDTALKIFEEQGEGEYYYSFYVKCVKKGTTAKIIPIFQLIYGGTTTGGDNIGRWPTGGVSTAGILIGDEWIKIEGTFDLKLEEQGKKLGAAIIYSKEIDFNKDKAADLYYDNVVLIKKSGGWKRVTPEPEVEVPTQTRVEDVERSEKTGIGAIYYHMWFETLENWWQYDNAYAKSKDRNSVQDGRCLAPDKHHYRLPFFTKINEAVTSSDKINGSVTTGVPEFPEFTEEIWKQEMEYAIEAGVDFMAYLWNSPKCLGEMGYQYHIKTKGLDGKIKMCAILQDGSQDINAMANAMTEDYWYTIDGMPVVYIYDAAKTATEDLIVKLRKKVAIAQFVKTGQVGKPLYIIAMGMTTYSTAVGISSRGVDAVGWYSVGATNAVNDTVKKEWSAAGISNDAKTLKSIKFARLAEYGLEMMKDVSKVWDKGYASVSPLITLGRNVLPRIENPVTWSMGSDGNLPYSGTYAEDPTPEEMTKNVLDVLNWNKEEKFSCNTVIMYCWNEYSEGGWFCPTIAVDEDGRVLKNADGSYKINREYLDAVKEAISLYREHEAENAIYDVDGSKIKDLVETTEAPQKIQAPKVTETPDADVPQEDENSNGNGWVLWAIIGGAVVVAAAAAVVVVIVLKKKKNANQAEATEE